MSVPKAILTLVAHDVSDLVSSAAFYEVAHNLHWPLTADGRLTLPD